MDLTLGITLLITLILLFISMVYSASAASDIDSKNYSAAHGQATTAAVIDGLAVLVIGCILGYALWQKYKA